jgi:hypothetical protein
MDASADHKPYTIDDHPNARRSIETSRSWAALITCGIVILLSIQAGSNYFDGIVRGLIAGSAMYLVVWTVAVMVWREIVRAEIKQARELVRERRAAARQAILDAKQAAAERDADT